MKKRVLCIALVVVMLFSLSMSAFAAQSDVSIVIDNIEVEFTASSGEPFVDANGRTQVPLRVVMEQYGCDVEWDSANNAAVIIKGDTTVIVPIGQSYILVNGKTVAMDTAALVQNGRTYLPIRAVLEAFGADVEWEDGKVSVSSPASGEFENIYVDKDGNLIFELANGNKINAGSVSNGKDGKDGRDGSDGVSVVNAYVDGSGNLMIVLSNGRTINAGNVGVGGSMSGLTFADYSVGTKFYLTQPTGAFDVIVNVGNIPYVVSFNSVYYELSAKHGYNDADAWKYGDGITTYQPYDVTMKISGQTSASLAGKYVTVTFGEVESGSWYYKGLVAADGTFQISHAQDAWCAPKNLMLSKVVIDNGSSTPGGSTDTPALPAPDDTPDNILGEDYYNIVVPLIAGTWSNDKNSFVVNNDGTFTINGENFLPYECKYTNVNDYITLVFIDDSGEWGMAFDLTNDECGVDSGNPSVNSGLYERGIYTVVTLTPENFMQYFEFKYDVDWNENAFGEAQNFWWSIDLILKDEYADKLYENWADRVSVELNYSLNHAYCKADLTNKIYTIGDMVNADSITGVSADTIKEKLYGEKSKISEFYPRNGMYISGLSNDLLAELGSSGLPIPEGYTHIVSLINSSQIVRVSGTLAYMDTSK